MNTLLEFYSIEYTEPCFPLQRLLEETTSAKRHRESFAKMIGSLEDDISNTIKSTSVTAGSQEESRATMMKLKAIIDSVEGKKKELGDLDAKIAALEGELKQA